MPRRHAGHVGHRVGPGLALALLVALLLAAPARALEVGAKVSSVRPGRVYLELERPLELRVGAKLAVKPGEAQADAPTVVVAISTKWVVVEAEGLDLKPGQTVRLVVDAAPAAPRGPSAASPGAAAAPAADANRPGGIDVGRAVPTVEDYAKAPKPEFVPVKFTRVTGAAAPRPASGAAAVPAGDARDAPAEGPDAPVERANEVHGRVEVGVDAANDDAADVSRTTPFALLSLEVERLGGSDRARLLFYGAVRRPFDGEHDLTGRRQDELIADISAAYLELEARPEDEVHTFTDRLELRLGRTTIPGVVEAGLVDGAQVGLRFGDVTPFLYGGAGASPDPRRSDYDTIVYGGGLRFEKGFAHAGAIRLSLAGGQQRFRGEGERDFFESQLDARWDRLGVRGAVVVDFYEAIRDRRDIRLTTGLLRLSYQLTDAVRLEVGYVERRQQFQNAFIRDQDPLLLSFLHPQGYRRTWDALLFVLLGSGWDLSLRGAYYEGGRPAYGAGVTLGKSELFTTDRLTLDLMAHHRLKGHGADEHSTDPFVSISYAYLGEVVTAQLTGFYRATLPDDTGDQRVGGRLDLDLRLGHGFGIRTYAEVETRRITDDRGEVYLLGLAARWEF